MSFFFFFFKLFYFSLIVLIYFLFLFHKHDVIDYDGLLMMLFIWYRSILIFCEFNFLLLLDLYCIFHTYVYGLFSVFQEFKGFFNNCCLF